MAHGHPQAYFESDQVIASSSELDPEPLIAALPASDGVRVSAVEGLGLVAARRTGDFTHVVTGLDGVFPIELTGWQHDDGDFEAMETRPVDLAFLADAPAGVATRLLDAALAGPVVFSEPDEDLRLAWIAWLTYALPDGARLTFSTAGDDGAHIRVADEPGAIDTTEPCDDAPTLYARAAVELAARGELRAAVARLEEPDGLALAVHGGVTDLIAPHQLPLALQLITELATAGHVREAARAAAALPTGGPSAALVVHEEIPALPEIVVEPEPEPEVILEAEVVEEEDPNLIRDDEIIEVPFELVREPAPEPPAIEPLPDADAWSSLLTELKTESVQPDESLPELPVPEPQEEEVVEEQEIGMSLAEFEESLKREQDA